MSPKRWLIALTLIAAIAALLLWHTRGDAPKSVAADDEHANASTIQSRTRGARDVDPFKSPKAAIRGVISGPDGKPVARALVCGYPSSDELAGEDQREPFCATSGADGRYLLSGLVPARYWVGATAEGLIGGEYEPPAAARETPDDTSFEVAAGATASGIDIVLEGGGVDVRGVVKDIGGGPIADAMVRVSARGEGGTSFARTRADGTFDLRTREGTVWVSADADGYGNAFKRALAPGIFVELILTPESVLAGRVVMAGTDEPVAGALVSAGASVNFDGGPRRSKGTAFTDSEGRFRISRLAPGRYTPNAEGRGLIGWAAESALLGLGQTVGGVIIEVHPAQIVSGRVVTKGTSEPCRHGSVQLQDNKQERWARGTVKNGDVELKAVRPGNYEVKVYCDAHISTEEFPEVVVAGDDLTDLLWEVRAGGKVVGTITDDQGKPVEQAWVELKLANDDPRRRRAWDGGSVKKDGRYEVDGIEPGTYDVELSAQGYIEPENKLTVEVIAGATATLDLQVATGGEIRGTVVDEAGKPQKGVRVRAQGATNQWGNSSARTLDDGSFRLRGLEAGEYRVTANRGWRQTLRAPGSTDDDIQGATTKLERGQTAKVNLVVETQDGTITGRVLDHNGAPVADAFIAAERQSESAGARRANALRSMRWSSVGGKPELTDVDGNFTVNDLSPGTYVVRAYRQGGGEAVAQDVAVGGSVTLTISPTASIEGKVVTSDGAGVQEVSIRVSDEKTGFSRRETFQMTGGVWAVRDLPAGTFLLTADAPEGQAKQTITVEGGERRTGVTFELESKITITGRVVRLDNGEPIEGMSVYIKPIKGELDFRWDERGNKHVTDAEGRFEFERAPAGRLYVIASPRDWDADVQRWGMKLVTAKGGASFDAGDVRAATSRVKSRERAGDLGFEMVEQTPNMEPETIKLEVSLVRPGGPAERAGLEVGDEIVSIDGHDCRTPNTYIFSALSRVPQGTTIELGLARGDTIELTAGKPL